MAKYQYRPALDFEAISYATVSGSAEWGEAASRPYALALDAWIKQSPGYFTLPQDLVVKVKRYHDGDRFREIKKNETVIGILVQLQVNRADLGGLATTMAALYHFHIRSKKPRVATIRKRAEEIVTKLRKTPKKKRERMLWQGFEQLAKNVKGIRTPQGVYMHEWIRSRVTAWAAIIALQWGPNEDYDYPERVSPILARIARGEEVIINKDDLEAVDGTTRLKKGLTKRVAVKKAVKKKAVKAVKKKAVVRQPRAAPVKKAVRKKPRQRRQNVFDTISEIIAEELQSAAQELDISIEEATRQFVRNIMARRRRR